MTAVHFRYNRRSILQHRALAAAAAPAAPCRALALAAPAIPLSPPAALTRPLALTAAAGFYLLLRLMPTVYLIPCWLEEHVTTPLPAYLLDAVKQCNVFFVENERSARRYLKALWKEMVIDDYEWHPIHKAEEEVKSAFRAALRAGRNIGIISEAGCPGIADPGQILTAVAHDAGAVVRPLVGPSSILLALMASGLNGQQFRFLGYLPVDSAGRTKALKDLEAESQRLNSTQIFIETPYRNNQLLATILATCRPTTRLCIAANLTGPTEYIRTLTIAEWNKLAPPPDLHKQPTIFSLLA